MELLRAAAGIGDQSLAQKDFPIVWVRTVQAEMMHDQMHQPSSGSL